VRARRAFGQQEGLLERLPDLVLERVDVASVDLRGAGHHAEHELLVLVEGGAVQVLEVETVGVARGLHVRPKLLARLEHARLDLLLEVRQQRDAVPVQDLAPLDEEGVQDAVGVGFRQDGEEQADEDVVEELVVERLDGHQVLVRHRHDHLHQVLERKDLDAVLQHRRRNVPFRLAHHVGTQRVTRVDAPHHRRHVVHQWLQQVHVLGRDAVPKTEDRDDVVHLLHARAVQLAFDQFRPKINGHAPDFTLQFVRFHVVLEPLFAPVHVVRVTDFQYLRAVRDDLGHQRVPPLPRFFREPTPRNVDHLRQVRHCAWVLVRTRRRGRHGR
jgi:hypothetical protein